MTAGSAGSGARLADGRVLLVGVGGCRVPAGANVYDPATGTWQLVAKLNGYHCSGYTLTVLADGRALAIGGQSPVLAEVFDPVRDRWTSVPSP